MKLVLRLIIIFGIISIIIGTMFISLFSVRQNQSQQQPDTIHINAFLPVTVETPGIFAENFDWEWDTVTIHRRPLDITYPKNAELLSLNLLSSWDAENRSYLVFRKNDAIVKIVSYPLSCVFYDDSNVLIQVQTYRSDNLFYTTEQVDHEMTIILTQQPPG